jgi:hypothetical protein
MRMECQSCGATYDTVQADGTEYYHACAPLSVEEIRAGLADGSVQLPARVANQLAVIDARTPALDVAGEAPALGDLYLAQLVIERPNKRDENLHIDRDTRAVRIIAAGAGAVEVVEAE